MRRLGCLHGPELKQAADEAALLAGPWNEWATKAALEKADWLALTTERRAFWLAGIGVEGSNQVLT